MTDAVDIATAAGALSAAAFTAWAARSASKAATTAKQGIAAEHKPILIDVPYERFTDYEHEIPLPRAATASAWRGEIRFDPANGTFAIPVRNVGRGLARVTSFEMVLADDDTARYAEYSTVAIPPGEDAYLVGDPDANTPFVQALQHQPSPLHTTMPLIFAATYTDATGGQGERVELGLGGRGGSTALRVLRVAHHPVRI